MAGCNVASAVTSELSYGCARGGKIAAQAKRDFAFDPDQAQFAGIIRGRARPDHPGKNRGAKRGRDLGGGADLPAADGLAEPADYGILDLVGVGIGLRPAIRRQFGNRLAAPRGAQQPCGFFDTVGKHPISFELPLSAAAR